MSDRLKLSDPKDDAEVARVAVAQELMADHQKIRDLEKNIAALEAELAKKDRTKPAPAVAQKNKIGARKQGSFMAISTAPSINRTPIGPSMVPVPYPTVQDLTNSIETAKTVNFNGCPAYLLDSSSQASCKGDAAGTGKGIRSGTVSGEVTPIQGSKTVRIEGKRAVREGDACTMNGGNNPGIYVTTEIPNSLPQKNFNSLQGMRNDTKLSAVSHLVKWHELSDAEKLNKAMQQDILDLDGSAFMHANYNFRSKSTGPMLVPWKQQGTDLQLAQTRNKLATAILSIFGAPAIATRLSGASEDKIAAANEIGAAFMGVAASVVGLPSRQSVNIEPHVRPSVTKAAGSDGLKIVAGRGTSGSTPAKYPVHTNPDEAFFWSGKTNGYGGDVAARKIASESRGTTLETLIEQRNIKMPAWDTNNPDVVSAWKTISAEYAAGASGTVRVVLGKDLRPGNVWETAELPALKNNPRVEKIVAIDPVTKIETEIFNRGKQ